jgi:hypothetical protein
MILLEYIVWFVGLITMVFPWLLYGTELACKYFNYFNTENILISLRYQLCLASAMTKYPTNIMNGYNPTKNEKEKTKDPITVIKIL